MPERGQILAVPLGNAVDRFLADKVDEFVHSDRFAELWTNAITRAHSRAIAVLKGDTNSRFFTVQGTQVVLDLAPVISAVLQRIAEAAPGLFSKINIPELSNENIQNAADRISAALGVQLPPNFGTIPVFDKSKLSNAQDAFRKVNRLVVAIVLLALILTTGAIAMSTNRRRTVMVIAIGFALGMIVARRLTIRVREDLLALFKDPINRAAADATSDRIVGSLLDLLAVIVVVSAVVALIMFLIGPARPAKAARSGVQSGFGRLRATAATARVHVTDRVGASDWVVTYRDPARVAVAAIGVFILLVATLSWAVLFVVVAVVAVAEVILTGVHPSAAGHGDTS